jgi:hypothetical protein
MQPNGIPRVTHEENAMPRYYFHYRAPDEHLFEDRLGSCHADLDAAEREAKAIAKEILAEELEDGAQPFMSRSIEIEDEAGEIVLYLPFWAAVSISSMNRSEGPASGNPFPSAA